MEKTIHENELLAAEYKRQQIYHMKTKAKVMDSLERKLALERSLQDHKSVSGFFKCLFAKIVLIL